MTAISTHQPTDSTIIHIKNMVCDRCIRVVGEEIEGLGFTPLHVELGQAEIAGTLTESDVLSIEAALKKNGFELLESKRDRTIEQIKHAVIDIVRHPHRIRENYSIFLSRLTGLEYPYLSSLFSKSEHITIEKFIILQKIEFVKELMGNNEVSLAEIAHEMGYSSVSHLSRQFKKTTGLTPTDFRNTHTKHRRTIDSVLVS